MRILRMNSNAAAGGRTMSREGFTLVELLVAMAILIFISVALLQTAIVNIEYNAKNAIRDEATRLGGEILDKMRNFNNKDANIMAEFNDTTGIYKRKVRNMTIKYDVINTVSPMMGGGLVFNYSLMVKVKWTWKGKTFMRTAQTVRPE